MSAVDVTVDVAAPPVLTVPALLFPPPELPVSGTVALTFTRFEPSLDPIGATTACESRTVMLAVPSSSTVTVWTDSSTTEGAPSSSEYRMPFQTAPVLESAPSAVR